MKTEIIKDENQDIRQALEICLINYKRHLVKFPKCQIEFEGYIYINRLESGLCNYMLERYHNAVLYNFFDILKIRYITKTPWQLDFDREKTIESFKKRIEWIENYLEQTKVKIS